MFNNLWYYCNCYVIILSFSLCFLFICCLCSRCSSRDNDSVCKERIVVCDSGPNIDGVNKMCVRSAFAGDLRRHRAHYDVTAMWIKSATWILVSVLLHTCDNYANRSSFTNSVALVREIHWWSVNSPHKGPVTRKMMKCNSPLSLVEVQQMLYSSFGSSRRNSCPGKISMTRTWLCSLLLLIWRKHLTVSPERSCGGLWERWGSKSG